MNDHLFIGHLIILAISVPAFVATIELGAYYLKRRARGKTSLLAYRRFLYLEVLLIVIVSFGVPMSFIGWYISLFSILHAAFIGFYSAHVLQTSAAV